MKKRLVRLQDAEQLMGGVERMEPRRPSLRPTYMTEIIPGRNPGWSRTTALAIALPATLLCLGVGARAASEHRPDAAEAQPLGDTVIIDPIAGETFTPAGKKGEAPKRTLSAAEAYRVYSGNSPEVPDGWTVQEGYVTLPLGRGTPGEYTAKDEFVYAYTVPQCAPEILPPPISEGDAAAGPASEEQQPSDAGCTRWLFVNASTGELIDMTWTKS